MMRSIESQIVEPHNPDLLRRTIAAGVAVLAFAGCSSNVDHEETTNPPQGIETTTTVDLPATAYGDALDLPFVSRADVDDSYGWNIRPRWVVDRSYRGINCREPVDLYVRDFDTNKHYVHSSNWLLTDDIVGIPLIPTEYDETKMVLGELKSLGGNSPEYNWYWRVEANPETRSFDIYQTMGFTGSNSPDDNNLLLGKVDELDQNTALLGKTYSMGGIVMRLQLITVAEFRELEGIPVYQFEDGNAMMLLAKVECTDEGQGYSTNQDLRPKV
jgi:hypothetical protein